MRHPEVWIELERLLELHDRLVMLAVEVEDPSHNGADDERERIRFLRPFYLREGFVITPHPR